MDDSLTRNDALPRHEDAHARAGGDSSRGRALPHSRRTLRQRPPKLYRIGELVDYSGVSRQTIHNYTTMGLLVESRWTEGGHRLYDETAFDRLDVIEQLKMDHKSLRQIREYFAEMTET